MQKIFEIAKICGALLFAYILVAVFEPQFFINNSPEVNVEYIAQWKEGIRESPSKFKVLVASLFIFSNNKEQEKQIEEFKEKSGATEVAMTAVENQQLAGTIVQTENPVPNAVFDYLSKGVAASTPDEQGKVVLRFDPNLGKEIKSFKLKDGRIINIMIGD